MENKAYTDGTYLQNNPTWHQEDSPWKARQIAKMFRANNLSPSTICDLGCGAGEIVKCLAKEFDDTVTFSGYELSPQAFEICKKKETDNLKFFLTDALEEKETTFDVVMAIDVFEHIEDYFGFLRKLRTKGEYKIFHIPLNISVQSILRCSPILDMRATVGHIHYFTKETALETLKDTGYEILDYFYTNSSLELANLGWKSNLLRLPRKFFFHSIKIWP